MLVRPFDIRAGNAVMYYPEANVLVPRDVDPQSKTPAFKSVLVEVVPESVPPRSVSAWQAAETQTPNSQLPGLVVGSWELILTGVKPGSNRGQTGV